MGKPEEVCIAGVYRWGTFLGYCSTYFKDTRWGRFRHRFITGHRPVA